MYKLQEQILLDYLKSITPFSTVLEVGCGFGRLTKIILSNFPEIKEYTAVDLSPHQIENAKKYVRSEIFGRNLSLKFIVSEILSLDIDRKFDLVIASEVLLHILPAEIDNVISKLVRLSNEHVINIDYYQEIIPKGLASHNFAHEYEKIYRAIPDIIRLKRIPIVKQGLFSKLDAKQSIFHAFVKTIPE